jgi:hypothetical protein
MVALKPLLLALLAGTSSAFAVMQPKAPLATLSSKSTVLNMSGGAAADPPPPELKVRYTNFGILLSDCLFLLVIETRDEIV